MMLIKRYFYISNKLSSRSYSKIPVKRRINPGMDRRLKLFKDEQADTRNIEIDEDAIDSLEQDVYESQNLHDLHEREINKIQRTIRFKQVERQYFTRQKLPNMLLWAEKEQIRLLAQSDPDLWTPQKLAECFPATVDIIKKLLKSQWKPDSEERIKSHDEAASANWSAFEKGSLQLPEYFANHLKLFTSRKKVLLKPDEKLPEVSIRTEGEFSDIIKNYKVRERKSETQDIAKPIYDLKSGANDSFKLGGKSNFKLRRKEYTLGALKKAIEDGELSDELSQALYKEYAEKSSAVTGTPTENKLNSTKESGVNIIEIEHVVPKNAKKFDDIIMQIKIPREKWKKGCIYKVSNCYYTDDGEFLYRV